jgi:hypothetical protein
MNVIKVSDVDINKVCVSETKGKKAKIFYTSDDGEQVAFKIQTGKMRVPWDPSRREYGGKLINIELNASTFEMYDDDNISSVRALRELITRLEVMHPMTDDLQPSSVIYGKNPNYSPTIKMNIPIRNDLPNVNVFNKGGGSIDFDSVRKGAICSFIVRVSHFWTSAKYYGLQLVIEQIMVFNTVQRHLPVIDDSDDDE